MSEAALGRVDFSFDDYERFLAHFLDRGYEFAGFGDPEPGQVLLRHDVDLSATRAAEMARIEADHGLTSTYFFLVSSPAYSLLSVEGRAALDEIEALGHDVGLHFDVHHHWDGEPDETTLTETVREELEGLSRLTSGTVDAVSFHVPPDWVLEREFDGFRNAYAPRYFGEVDYVSDSNQKWRDEPVFGGPVPETVQVLVHPGLWTPDGDPLDEVLGTFRDRLEREVREYVEPLGS